MRLRKPGARQKMLYSYERRLSCEPLESRQLMAVTASLDRGTLTITGDDAADEIAIVGTANPGELAITGRNGTTVNGISDGNATIPGVLDSLIVNLNGGNDVLSLDNVFIAGSITLDTGDGDDLVTLAAADVVSSRSSLNIHTGAGDDQVEELNYAVFVGGSHLIELGEGEDRATVIGASAAGGGFSGPRFQLPYVPSISLQGGDGSDSILGIGVTAVLALAIDGGNGVNSLALLNSAAEAIGVSGGTVVYLDTNYARTRIGAGSDTTADSSVSVFRCLCTELSISLGRGNNFAHVYGNAVNGPPYAVFGGEPFVVGPTLTIHAANSPGQNVQPPQPLYQNTNTVLVTYNVGESFRVSLGDGDDSLTMIGNSMTATALDGLSGVNTAVEQGNSLGAVTRKNFA